MGCILPKLSLYSPSCELEKFKLDGRYVNGGKPTRHPKALLVKGGGREKPAVAREGEREVDGGGSGGGNVPRRVTGKKIAADELVDGYPKWLVDNIPMEVLAGLVRKSAESYVKLSKVCSKAFNLLSFYSSIITR